MHLDCCPHESETEFDHESDEPEDDPESPLDEPLSLLLESELDDESGVSNELDAPAPLKSPPPPEKLSGDELGAS